MGREDDYSELISAENSLTGSSSKYVYVKAEMKLKQGVLLVAALIQLVRNLPTCLSVISAQLFIAPHASFVFAWCCFKKKGRELQLTSGGRRIS